MTTLWIAPCRTGAPPGPPAPRGPARDRAGRPCRGGRCRTGRRWAEPWSPPLDPEELQSWGAFDDGALLDDVAAVLDDVIPPEEHVDELAERLRGHSMRLVTIAVAAEAEERDAAAAWLIEQTRTLRCEHLPGGHWIESVVAHPDARRRLRVDEGHPSQAVKRLWMSGRSARCGG
ncbi:DUF6415 family natural product biosynthesis protein [Streptomyces sp. NPDC059866]|uniref:DUF6415 family natural product biosynthesis protein n=1 Tax=Streptomyces sp. NPDC059866 TaxID=3346978 RepID=UPI003657F448